MFIFSLLLQLRKDISNVGKHPRGRQKKSPLSRVHEHAAEEAYHGCVSTGEPSLIRTTSGNEYHSQHMQDRADIAPQHASLLNDVGQCPAEGVPLESPCQQEVSQSPNPAPGDNAFRQELDTSSGAATVAATDDVARPAPSWSPNICSSVVPQSGQPPSLDVASAEMVRYKTQLDLLKEMGYDNEDELLGLLNYHHGDIDMVLEALQRIRVLPDDHHPDPLGNSPAETLQRASAAYDELLLMGFTDKDKSLMSLCLQLNGNVGELVDHLTA